MEIKAIIVMHVIVFDANCVTRAMDRKRGVRGESRRGPCYCSRHKARSQGNRPPLHISWKELSIQIGLPGKGEAMLGSTVRTENKISTSLPNPYYPLRELMSEVHYDGGLHATSSAIERVLDSVNRSSPINLEFVTRPFGKASIARIQSLELIYAKSRLFRFLVSKGVNPILLFVSLSAGIAGGLRRFYKQSTQLALTLLGVVYPAWKCWQLVKEQNGLEQEREYKSWLTYWLIYGTFQGKLDVPRARARAQDESN